MTILLVLGYFFVGLIAGLLALRYVEYDDMAWAGALIQFFFWPIAGPCGLMICLAHTIGRNARARVGGEPNRRQRIRTRLKKQ